MNSPERKTIEERHKIIARKTDILKANNGKELKKKKS